MRTKHKRIFPGITFVIPVGFSTFLRILFLKGCWMVRRANSLPITLDKFFIQLSILIIIRINYAVKFLVVGNEY